MIVQTEESVVFCKTCGIASIHPGHLCNPAPLPPEGAFACNYCGKVATDSHHICQPIALMTLYTCQKCGRSSNRKDLLCTPEEIVMIRQTEIG
ncbi:MAG: hypothetical protein HYY20_07995 [Candidatus Tectomicrobia bacterium]|uniref:Uncharacterized protein n=1 Tax=Tectimicrobiota bacterium TaxID=2528274 RepID=A0A932FWY1_UNCTE|nr:hypothetical protein [Candidatus Tectomicrobia bacterium]